MSGLQRIIKYCALAFAAFLIISIVSGIMGGVAIFSGIFNNKDNKNDSFENLNISSDAKIIDIDLVSSSLIVKKGDTLKAESNNKYINVKQDKDKLYIEEKKHNFFSGNSAELIVYIPTDFLFDGVSIDSGAGKVTIEDLTTDVLEFDFGAGSVTINNLNVNKHGKINSGAGEFKVMNGNLNNIDLDLGAGKLNLTFKITGSSKISSGVGETNIDLIGNRDDYKIKVDKGIGSINIDGQSVNDGNVYGNGVNKIDVDSGIGSININFIDK